MRYRKQTVRAERREGGGNAEEERRERVPGDGIAERHRRGEGDGKRWEPVNGGAAAERDDGRVGRRTSGPTDERAEGEREEGRADHGGGSSPLVNVVITSF